MLGQRFGLQPEWAQYNGWFTINKREGKISFSSNLSERLILFEYISDGLAYEEDTKVPKLAEEALYMHIAYSILASRQNIPEHIVQRYKKDRKIFTTSSTDGKHAHTLYSILEEFQFSSLVKLKLMTGRTHQIRVHMASINHPIFGDPTYGGRRIVYGMNLPKMKNRVDNLLSIIKRQALHAKTLGFIHPTTKEKMKFDSELPEDMKLLIVKLKSNND